MPRYMVERNFPDTLQLTPDAEGLKICDTVISNNLPEHVTWIHSYVSDDKTKTFCIYDAPAPEAIRAVAEKNGLPVDRITEVRVLDPYFHN